MSNTDEERAFLISRGWSQVFTEHGLRNAARTIERWQPPEGGKTWSLTAALRIQRQDDAAAIWFGHTH